MTFVRSPELNLRFSNPARPLHPFHKPFVMEQSDVFESASAAQKAKFIARSAGLTASFVATKASQHVASAPSSAAGTVTPIASTAASVTVNTATNTINSIANGASTLATAASNIVVDLLPVLRGWYKYGLVPVTRQIQEDIAQNLFVAKKSLTEYDWKRLHSDVWNYAKAHPYKTAFYVAGAIFAGVLVFNPMLIVGPVLGSMGWTAVGPAAGTIAAGLQASMGNVAAGSLFAILQSAAMGGAGAIILGTVLSAATVGTVAVGTLVARLINGEPHIMVVGDEELKKIKGE